LAADLQTIVTSEPKAKKVGAEWHLPTLIEWTLSDFTRVTNALCHESGKELHMSLHRICVREVDLAEPYESVQAAADRMLARNVGSLVIVDAERKPVGIITDRDLTLRVMAAGRNPYVTTVSEVMTQPVSTVPEDASIGEVILAMRSGPHRRLIVVDECGGLAGVVSIDDLLDMLIREFAELCEVLRNESPRVLAHV
jgi:CBS domain-containing protein